MFTRAFTFVCVPFVYNHICVCLCPGSGTAVCTHALHRVARALSVAVPVCLLACLNCPLVQSRVLCFSLGSCTRQVRLSVLHSLVLFLPTFLPYNHLVVKENLLVDDCVAKMSVFNADLLELLRVTKAPANFIAFLKEVEVESPLDLAGLASDEAVLSTLFVDMGCDAIIEQVKVRRARLRARVIWNAALGGAGQSGVEAESSSDEASCAPSCDTESALGSPPGTEGCAEEGGESESPTFDQEVEVSEATDVEGSVVSSGRWGVDSEHICSDGPTAGQEEQESESPASSSEESSSSDPPPGRKRRSKVVLKPNKRWRRGSQSD